MDKEFSEKNKSTPHTAKQKEKLIEELGLSREEYKALKKKFKKFKDRDDKAFMDMLRAVSRNHYLLNQMVDRKARILLSVNALIISIIIGQVVISLSVDSWAFNLLTFFSITCFISIYYSMMAIRPEKTHGHLDREAILTKTGNPLFYGNFNSMPEKLYVDAMMEMVNDREFIYRSMIQDIYHLGLVLARKRQHLRHSLHVFVIGLWLSLAFAFLLKLLYS